MNPDEAQKILKQASTSLGEYFDSVRIIVTAENGDSFALHSFGSGSYYAQLGAVRDWLIHQEEYSRTNARAAAFSDSAEDGGSE